MTGRGEEGGEVELLEVEERGLVIRVEGGSGQNQTPPPVPANAALANVGRATCDATLTHKVSLKLSARLLS